jgi:2-polyprenyl-6-methoxyphenol hydroxylase-like FAD-dependent oxidoreductase
MTQVNGSNKRRALIIGGSLGGLFAANLLHQIGWDVDIFERSAHDLDSRGGGIVLQPEVVEVFRRAGVDIRSVDLGVRSEKEFDCKMTGADRCCGLRRRRASPIMVS